MIPLDDDLVEAEILPAESVAERTARVKETAMVRATGAIRRRQGIYKNEADAREAFNRLYLGQPVLAEAAIGGWLAEDARIADRAAAEAPIGAPE